MPAATIEQSSKGTPQVFVAGGRHRNHAVRLAAATLGLLLAGWLTALAAGLIGFSPLPELTLPGTGSAHSGPAPPGQGTQPVREREAGAQASPIASPAEGSGDKVIAAGRSAPGVSSENGTGGAAGQAASGGGGIGSTPPDTGSGAPQSPTTPPGRGAETPASSGNPPSFTPPTSGERSASPPRGNSGNAPGKTVSVDPPGTAARADSG